MPRSYLVDPRVPAAIKWHKDIGVPMIGPPLRLLLFGPDRGLALPHGAVSDLRYDAAREREGCDRRVGIVPIPRVAPLAGVRTLTQVTVARVRT